MKKLLRHFSHPHALEPVENDDNEEGDNKEICITCCGCDQQLSTNNNDEPSYFCPKPDCEFYLHKSCFELPKTLDHKSHPDHTLKLQYEPPAHRIYYGCNACGDEINAFSFHCQESCDFKLHPKCAFLPDTVDCKAHDLHALAIQHCTPKNAQGEFDTVLCDVCDGYISEEYWSYFCKDCDFGTHLECAFSAEVAVEPVEEEEEEEINEEGKEEVNAEGEEEEVNAEGEEEEGELSDAMRLHLANVKAMEHMARIKLQMQLAEMNARAMASMFRTRY